MRKPWLPLAFRSLPLFALAAPLTAAGTAAASSLIALDLPGLVEQSDYVVIGNAASQTSRYADGAIVTDVTLKVISSLKGNAKPGEKLVVTHLGGAVGQVGLRVPGAASFKLGQSAVVFLRRTGRAGDDLNVTGMSQGVMSISGSAGSEQVESGTAGATLMQRNAQDQLVPTEPASQKRPLATLLTEIDQLVKR
jgi:hypothetical protein